VSCVPSTSCLLSSLVALSLSLAHSLEFTPSSLANGTIIEKIIAILDNVFNNHVPLKDFDGDKFSCMRQRQRERERESNAYRERL